MKISDLVGKVVKITNASSFSITFEELNKFPQKVTFKIEPLEDSQEIRVWKSEISPLKLLVGGEEKPREEYERALL